MTDPLTDRLLPETEQSFPIETSPLTVVSWPERDSPSSTTIEELMLAPQPASITTLTRTMDKNLKVLMDDLLKCCQLNGRPGEMVSSGGRIGARDRPGPAGRR
ncbi:MAG: hypothetical protein GTO30_05515 [Acidobacteria bacterium]|nr:hypothetical protein [Acidobacteriota bacterium]NIQ86820.1 hypothetical protein [Acidobacteriota bacterium]